MQSFWFLTMCGIAGILNLNNTKAISEDLIARMISILRHRGPDETGMYIDSYVGLVTQDVYFVPSLPKSASGKVDKQRCETLIKVL